MPVKGPPKSIAEAAEPGKVLDDGRQESTGDYVAHSLKEVGQPQQGQRQGCAGGRPTRGPRLSFSWYGAIPRVAGALANGASTRQPGNAGKHEREGKGSKDQPPGPPRCVLPREHTVQRKHYEARERDPDTRTGEEDAREPEPAPARELLQDH